MTAALISLFAGKLKFPQWLVELLIGVFVVAVLAGGGFWLGWSHRGDADQLAAQKAELAAQAQLAQANARGEMLSAKLGLAIQQTRVEYRTITEEVPHVVFKTAPAAPGAPVPHMCVAGFTAGFVSLWNLALDPGVPAATGRAFNPATVTDTADSGITQSDLLFNHIDNAQQCTEVRQQLGALIEWFNTTQQ